MLLACPYSRTGWRANQEVHEVGHLLDLLRQCLLWFHSYSLAATTVGNNLVGHGWNVEVPDLESIL